MSLKASNKVETNIWELEVTVDGETFEAAVNKAYLKQKKNITVHGFRKGKAPRAFIEKLYGEGVFYEDALEIVYPEAVQAAIEEADLHPVDAPYDLDVTEIGKNGVSMKMKVVVKPEIELTEYKGIKATKKSSKVSAAEVKAELAKMQEQNARIVTVEGRNVKKDDIAVIDFEGFTDGVAFDGGKAENFELTIGSGQFIPGFEDQIIGHAAGDEFDVNVKFPEEYQAELAGKDATFKIKLHEIKVKELPALDDEFVKDVSEHETVDELKKSVKADLEAKKAESAKAEADNAVLDALAANVQAEIPAVMVEKQIDASVEDFSYRLQAQGLTMETYMQYTGMDMAAFREGFKERAEVQVKLNLAFEKIAELENLEVTDEDLAAEYKKYADAYNMDVEDIKKAISAETVKPDLLSRKAVEFVLANADVTEEKATRKKAAKKDEEAADAE